MNRYPWLNSTYYKILNVYQKGKGHHALLIDSKWNIGEDIIIYSIIRWLICSNPNNMQCCNSCYNCHLMKIGNHPNYYQLDLVNNLQNVGIDSIRLCIDAIQKCIIHDTVKVIFIKYVENLTNQASNALLKILEEPPLNTYFFLKTREYENTSLMITSRCMRWNIVPPQESVGLQWLTQKCNIDDMSLAQCALRLCHRSPIEAESMLKTDLWRCRLSLCNSINNAIISGDFLSILPFLKNQQKYNITLYWLVTLILDSLKWGKGIRCRFIINVDQIELISIIANYWDELSLNRQLSQWLFLIRYFQKFTNIHHELLLTYRLLNWKNNIIESCFRI